MSTDEQATAIKAIIASAAQVPALDLDDAQAAGTSLPTRYVEVHLSRRYGGNVRGGTRESGLRRLQTRAVAKNVSDARLIEDRIDAAFKASTFDVAGSLVHFAYESGGGEFDYDSATGRYHALTDWTFGV